MNRSALHRFSDLIKVDIVYEDADGQPKAYFDSVEDSPLIKDVHLRTLLRESAVDHSSPFLYRDSFGVWFAAFVHGEGQLYLGPMCSSRLDPKQRRAFFLFYQIQPEDARPLRTFTLRQIEDISLLAATLLKGTDVEEPGLYALTKTFVSSEQALRLEQHAAFSEEEAARDEGEYRHTYHEEQKVIMAVREGRTQDAIRMSEQMDAGTGRLASSDLIHWRTLAIVGITLVARAAISVGVPPATAYHASGYYITKINAAANPEAALYYRNCGIEDFCARVRETKSVPDSSEYTKRSKDYIQKHFREKIYIEDIAAPLGISAGYLARLFKKETGMLIQDYINLERVERAANLLTYSDYSLSAIANYVHFPTQSYFGKIFKQIKGVTPNTYRKQHQISEFWQRSNHRCDLL